MAGDLAQFLPPDASPLLLMERASLAKLPAASETALRFVTVSGRIARFWMRPDGLIAAAGEGDVVVSARATADGRVPVVVAVPTTVTIAAPAEIVIALRTGGSPSGELARFNAQPPTAQTFVTLPAALAEGSEFRLEATARLPDGSTLQGLSAVYLAARGPANAPGNLRGNSRGPTVAVLEWDRSRDAAAYLVTRTPAAWSGPARVVSTSRFEDLGLSGGRQYDYEVCPVDARDVPGPCSNVSVRMPGR
jgi:hypothetical protein